MSTYKRILSVIQSEIPEECGILQKLSLAEIETIAEVVADEFDRMLSNEKQRIYDKIVTVFTEQK